MAEAVTKSPGPIGEAAFPRCLPTLRETLLDTWLRLTKALRDPYRPELHYMLGPGPKWRERHGADGKPASRCDLPAIQAGIALNVCGGPDWTSGWHQVRNWGPTR
jgi:hypothetical protein